MICAIGFLFMLAGLVLAWCGEHIHKRAIPVFGPASFWGGAIVFAIGSLLDAWSKAQ